MEFKFFILEDDNERIKHFVQRFRDLKREGIEVKYDLSKTAEGAIEFLSKNTYDMLLLDHDLGGEVYVDTEHKNTGSEVARWIHGSDLEFKTTQCIVHSMNTPAARHMKSLIETKMPTVCQTGIWFPEVFTRVFSFA